MGNSVTQVSPFSKLPLASQVKTKEQITRADLESPRLGKGWSDLVQVDDLFHNPNEEQKNTFCKRWLPIAMLDKTGEKEKDCLLRLIESGYTKEQAESIIEYSYRNVDRAKESAIANNHFGRIASYAASGSILFGVIKHLFDFESHPVVKTVIGFAQGVAKSIRSFIMYGKIYNREDDDASLNRYLAEKYGNKISGHMAKAAVTTETAINTWAYPLVELLPENLGEAAKKIISNVNPLYWRSRQPADVNQQFFTDFLSYVTHIVPSLFGVKKSVEVINGVAEREHIKPSYFFKRHYENAGLTDKKDQSVSKLIGQVFKLIKGSFSSDIVKQKESYTKLGKTIAPTLGMYGFFAVGIGAVVGSVLKLFRIESKFFDFVSSSGATSQQIIYLPKIVLPIFNRVKEVEAELSQPDAANKYGKEKVQKLKDLSNRLRNLSYMGVTTLLANVLNTGLKLKHFENPILKSAVDVIDEVAGGLINNFFSHRRHVIGHGFKVENPEFYDEYVDESAPAETAPSPEPSPNGTPAKQDLAPVH